MYCLERVQALVEDENRLTLLTRKCQRDVHNLFDSDLERVAELIQGLRKDCYIDSEWCENGKGAWAACDAYSVSVLETAPATSRLTTMPTAATSTRGQTPCQRPERLMPVSTLNPPAKLPGRHVEK